MYIMEIKKQIKYISNLKLKLLKPNYKNIKNKELTFREALHEADQFAIYMDSCNMNFKEKISAYLKTGNKIYLGFDQE